MAKKRKSPPSPRVHPDLKGFRIDVDDLGEIRMNRSLEEIGDFLKAHMPESPPTTEGGDPEGAREEE